MIGCALTYGSSSSWVVERIIWTIYSLQNSFALSHSIDLPYDINFISRYSYLYSLSFTRKYVNQSSSFSRWPFTLSRRTVSFLSISISSWLFYQFLLELSIIRKMWHWHLMMLVVNVAKYFVESTKAKFSSQLIEWYFSVMINEIIYSHLRLLLCTWKIFLLNNPSSVLIIYPALLQHIQMVSEPQKNWSENSFSFWVKRIAFIVDYRLILLLCKRKELLDYSFQRRRYSWDGG